MKRTVLACVENLDDSLADFEPPKKKTNYKRFKQPTDDKEMLEISKGYIPPNTQKNTSWAINVFDEWRAARSKLERCDRCPEDIPSNPRVESLNCWIPRFIVGARKQDGSPYPPKTIHQILAGIQ